MMNEIDELDKALDNVVKDFKKNRKALCNEVGHLMKNKVIENINASVSNESTGNLARGVTLELGSKGGYSAVKPDYNIAPHTHLIEEGHRIVKGGTLSKAKGKRKAKNNDNTGKGQIVGFYHGIHMYRNALEQVSGQVEEKANALANTIGDNF